MLTRISTIAIGAATFVFLVALVVWALSFASTGQPLMILAAAALAFFAVLGFWTVGYELYFGAKAQKLGEQLEKEGTLPEETVPVKPSGRVERDEALPLFTKYQEEVTAAPKDWRTWYRLGLVYDATGDRGKARRAVRTAIRLSRAER